MISATQFPTNGLNRFGLPHSQLSTIVVSVQAYVSLKVTGNSLKLIFIR